MNIIEIPEAQRGLGMCFGCKPNKHYCSHQIDGHYYCGKCADKKLGTPLVTAKDVVEANTTPPNIGPKPTTSQFPFTLNPIKTTNVAIGQLNTGWVLSWDGQNHVCNSKKKLLDKLNELIGAKE